MIYDDDMNLISTKLKNLSILFILIINLTSCSSTRLVYTLAGEFIQNETNYFVNMEKEDKVFLSQQVSEMLKWHRTKMLPNYSSYLQDTAEKISLGQYGNIDIKNTIEISRSLIEETVNGLTPYASKFLVRHQTLKDIEFMKKKMEKRQQQRLNEFSKSKDKLYQERLERIKSNFERFFGDLTDKQEHLLEQHASATQNDALIRFNNRTKRQKVFLEFLKTQPSEMELTKYLNKLLLHGHEITNPAHKNFDENSLIRFRVLLVSLLENSSEVQRENIIKKLLSYAEDFKNVSQL